MNDQIVIPRATPCSKHQSASISFLLLPPAREFIAPSSPLYSPPLHRIQGNTPPITTQVSLDLAILLELLDLIGIQTLEVELGGTLDHLG